MHPYALKNLTTAISHVKRFQEQVNQANPKTENALLSKEALVDVIDSSGIILNGLLPLLEEFEKSAGQTPCMYKALVLDFSLMINGMICSRRTAQSIGVHLNYTRSEAVHPPGH